MQIAFSSELLECDIENDTITNPFNFQLNGTNVEIIDKRKHDFSVTKLGNKRQKQTMEPLETLIIRGQQSFELHDQTNPIQITIDDDRVLNTLKKYAGVFYKFTSIGLLFPASVNNNTNQIFVTFRKLNDAKTALVNGKLVNLLRVINLNKTNN